ncbi:MAG TPA: A/G-specific adenine glycosylase [Burkholderiales bacterium]|nr:A/G-specific adenine glycosylase [Burkholderiales bacterium]
MRDFARNLVRWQRLHGRHDLPWQRTRDPYPIWLSEVMLQQTRVETVLPYFERFLARFPDLRALARAPVGEVLRLWSGLGYYARARNLHAAARQIVRTHAGSFPRTVEELEELPGIGRSTAGAVTALAFGRRAAILDGNAKRVFARTFGVEGKAAQWALAEKLLPSHGIRRYTQGLMDLGATVCKREKPLCARCPVADRCVAYLEGRIDELPSPRRRKQIPVRGRAWLVLLHEGRVLLEPRPPTGLWGGLWTFPESGSDDAVEPAGRLLGCEIGCVRRGAQFDHVFTHFRLRIEPVICEVRRVMPRAEQSGRRWFRLKAAAAAAVPTPVRTLLLQELSVDHSIV